MTTPTTQVTWFDGQLIHYALMQPRALSRIDLCDLLVACLGYQQGAGSQFLRPLDAVITCLSCLGTNWQAIVSAMAAKGRLTAIQDIETDTILHRILMESGAFALSAVRYPLRCAARATRGNGGTR